MRRNLFLIFNLFLSCFLHLNLKESMLFLFFFYSRFNLSLFLHSGLGVHISFVRSVRMDVWTDKQLAFMKLGGNERFIQYIQDHGNYHNEPYDANIPNYFIQKYDSPAAQLYKQLLIAEYEGKPIPTTLPPPRQQQQQSSLSRTSTTPRRKMEGFGSSPMPEQNDSSGMAKKASIAAVAVAAAAIVIWIIVPHS